MTLWKHWSSAGVRYESLRRRELLDKKERPRRLRKTEIEESIKRSKITIITAVSCGGGKLGTGVCLCWQRLLYEYGFC